MDVGSALIGVAVVLVVAAYLARPFRSTWVSRDLDRVIEGWVAQVRAEGTLPGEDGAPGACPRCGHPVAPDDRYCAACGAPLPGSVE
jgi:hypothetical protein